MLDTDPTSPAFSSYASVDVLRRYAAARGYEIPTDDAECEALLIQAMDYLAGIEWRGTRAANRQPQAWPRSGVLYDRVKVPDSVIPQQVIHAQCRLAIEAQEIDLSPSFASGGEVTQESVSGVVSVSYAAGTGRDKPSFSWFNGLLRGLIGSSSSVRIVRG